MDNTHLRFANFAHSTNFDNTLHQQLLVQQHFSSSAFSPQQRPITLLQYINPNSNKALRVFQAHTQNNVKAEANYKTVMCQNWLEQAECRFGSKCRFAHGPDELRVSTTPLPINNKYKTRLCEKYTKNGVCPYGQRCLFIHPNLGELSSSSTSTTFASSLPLSLFHFQQDMACRQRQALQKHPLTTRQVRNLLPQIEEELRREREEPKQHHKPKNNGLHLDIPPTSALGVSSSRTPEQIEYNGLCDMVDKLLLTPSAKLFPGDLL